MKTCRGHLVRECRGRLGRGKARPRWPRYARAGRPRHGILGTATVFYEDTPATQWPYREMGPLPRGPREEVVQGAGMLGPFDAQGAAESDASVRLGVRSHVLGRKRDRAPAEEAAIVKAKP